MNRVYKKLLVIVRNIPINIFLFHFRFLRINKSKKVKFEGFTIFIQDSLSFYYELIYIFRDKIYSFETQKKTPFIIDGGACIGTSIFYFKKEYPHAKILAFEPSREVFQILENNIKCNKLENVELINKGLYDSTTQLSFSKNNVDSGKIEDRGEDTISVVKLSEYIEQDVDYLKLNIEGAENAVFKDLDETGKINKIKELCFEWHSFANETQGLDQILAILKKNNFKYYISSLSTVRFGEFKAEKNTEYFLIIYAKKIN